MLLQGKKALILGLANNKSIAYGIANAFKEQGARLAFNYVGDAIKKRVEPLSEELGGEFTFQCDVTDDAQIQAAADLVKEKWGEVDILVHSVAFANREDLSGPLPGYVARRFPSGPGHLRLLPHRRLPRFRAPAA